MHVRGRVGHLFQRYVRGPQVPPSNANDLPRQPLCSYSDKEDRRCKREARPLQPHPYCTFHLGLLGPEVAEEYAGEFATQFAELLPKQDGSWQGFVFPPGVKFPKELGFPIDASAARFSALELTDVAFKEPVDFSEATFVGGIVMRGVKFQRKVTFDRCHIDGALDLLQVQCRRPPLSTAQSSLVVR